MNPDQQQSQPPDSNQQQPQLDDETIQMEARMLLKELSEEIGEPLDLEGAEQPTEENRNNLDNV